MNPKRTLVGAAVKPAPSANVVLAIVSAGAFMTALDLFIVNIAFPDIQRDFTGSTLSGLSWILNAYSIVFAALLVPAGRLADRIGQKRGFLIGMILFTAASALCAVATGPETLVAARVLQAAGAAAVTPTSLALLLGAVPLERRPWALGIWTSVMAIAAALGPTIGGLLVSLSWRWVFLVNLPIGIAATLVAIRVLQEERPESTGRRPDLFGALLLTIGIAALSLGIIQGPEWEWSSPKTLAAFATSVVAIAWFAYRSAHHPSPIVEPELLRVRSFAVAAIASFFFNAAFGVMLLSLVQFMTEVWGYSALRTGLAIGPGPMIVPFVAARGPQLVRRIGAVPVVLLGTALYAGGALFWIAFVGVEHTYFTSLLPGLLMAGIGFALTLPVLLTTAARSLPPHRFATGSAVVTMARQIGAVVGVSLLIVLLDGAGRDIIGAFQHAWMVMAGASVAAGVTCLWIWSEKRSVETVVIPASGGTSPAQHAAQPVITGE